MFNVSKFEYAHFFTKTILLFVKKVHIKRNITGFLVQITEREPYVSFSNP